VADSKKYETNWLALKLLGEDEQIRALVGRKAQAKTEKL
jgi:hypothetical protein